MDIAAIKSTSTVDTAQNSIVKVNKLTNDDIEKYSMTNILLPNRWILYTYDKGLFKKITVKSDYKASPNKKICTISTVNDFVYILHLMEAKVEKKSDKRNLDSYDYIFMREGIEPIWEDEKNKNGGMFTIKMNHESGYDVWCMFMMYMIGETMSFDMDCINGITVSYINNKHLPGYQTTTNTDNSSSYTFIKIWDAQPDGSVEKFLSILPANLREKIKNESLRYTPHNNKRHFGCDNLVNCVNSSQTKDYRQNNNRRGNARGGFVTNKRRR